MKKRLCLFFAIMFACASLGFGQLSSLASIQGDCEQGGQTVSLSGLTSTTKVQRSYPSCTVTVWVTDSSPYTKATLYSDSTGTVTSNPITADSTGHWQFWATGGNYDIVFSGGGISTPFTRWSVSNAAAQKQSWYDVTDKSYAGGAVGDGTVDDTAAIQATINAAVASARGGIVLFPPGNYKITSALTISMGSSQKSLQIIGSGIWSTLITQSDVTKDIFQIGTTGQEWADHIHVADLSTSGGRYALYLNNALAGVFERLRITSPVRGIYMIGQNERHHFRDIQIDGASLEGIRGGVTNGGTGSPALDFPEVQKCTFEKVRVSSTTGGTAIVITAGILSVQQSSGHNQFKEILLEGNARSGMEIYHSFNTTIDGFSNEDTLDTNNTYYILFVGAGSDVRARDFQIGAGMSANNYVDYIAINSSRFYVSDSNLAGGGNAVSGRAIYVDSASILTVQSCILYDSNSIAYVSAAVRANSRTWETIDSSGNSLGEGFYGTTPIAQQVFATGTGKTVDQLITVLQNLGLIRQTP